MSNIKILEITKYYQQEECWRGEIVLREDLSFEGISVVNDSDVDEIDYILCGYLCDSESTAFVIIQIDNGEWEFFYENHESEEILNQLHEPIYYEMHKNDETLLIFKQIETNETVVNDIIEKIEKLKLQMNSQTKRIYNIAINAFYISKPQT